MTVNNRRKSSRFRGSNTHGWGRNKHRGSGSRGGVGRAGGGKRAAHTKPSVYKIKRYRGKHGFSPKGLPTASNPINLRDVESRLDSWLSEKKISKEGEVFVVDLSKLGFTKLLSTGQARRKLKVSVLAATARAKEKVSAVGGEVTV